MDNVLHDFRLQLQELLNTPTGLPDQGIATANVIAQRLESELRASPRAKQSNPLSDALQQVADTVDDLPEALQPLVNTILDLTDYLIWYKRQAPLPEFMQGHANADIIGPKGLVVRDDIQVGITLMQPELTYPDHHHLPEEIYIVLSEGFWRQNDRPWHSPGPGGYVYNPADIIHAMKSVDRPLFALWCLKLT